MIILCSERAAQASYMGRPFDSMWAIHPKVRGFSSDRWTGVFIDARDLGVGFLFHVFMARFISTEEVFEFLHVELPAGNRMMLSGGDPSDPSVQRAIKDGDLLTVWLERLPRPLISPESEVEGRPSTDAEDDAPASGANSWQRPFDLSVAIFQPFTETLYLQFPVIPEDDVDSMMNELLDGYLEAQGAITIATVKPQPADESLCFVVSSPWLEDIGLQPVLVDCRACGGQSFRGVATYVMLWSCLERTGLMAQKYGFLYWVLFSCLPWTSLQQWACCSLFVRPALARICLSISTSSLYTLKTGRDRCRPLAFPLRLSVTSTLVCWATLRGSASCLFRQVVLGPIYVISSKFNAPCSRMSSCFLPAVALFLGPLSEVVACLCSWELLAIPGQVTMSSLSTAGRLEWTLPALLCRRGLYH